MGRLCRAIVIFRPRRIMLATRSVRRRPAQRYRGQARHARCPFVRLVGAELRLGTTIAVVPPRLGTVSVRTASGRAVTSYPRRGPVLVELTARPDGRVRHRCANSGHAGRRFVSRRIRCRWRRPSRLSAHRTATCVNRTRTCNFHWPCPVRYRIWVSFELRAHGRPCTWPVYVGRWNRFCGAPIYAHAVI